MSLIRSLLSHDLPRSRVLAALLLLTVLALALTPFVFPGTKALPPVACTSSPPQASFASSTSRCCLSSATRAPAAA